MKRQIQILILTICLLTISRQLFSQESNKKHFFKEVGWTILLPSDFHVLDSAANAAKVEHGRKEIEESAKVKYDYSATKTLIAANKDAYNYFTATIEPFDTTKERFDVFHKQEDLDHYKTYTDLAPTAKIDTSTTSIIIDNLVFKKFHTTLTFVKENLVMHIISLSKYYKGYDFSMRYASIDPVSKEQIESMLRHSKFKKK